MKLNSQQKNYLKKNLRKIGLEQSAKNLGVPENAIIKYLEKKWGSDKLETFFRK